ncbi:MAG TPA: hypothetical protein DCS75_05940 [Gemmatimonadetes bacterium]|nr:hypothetical protein [Gemmatimonadota bacterium]|tara:strand:+ start:267 stop:782 length:516 start_codon:yes stop_codon:yes gene_type:complete
MINWKYYPASRKPPKIIRDVIATFEAKESVIDSLLPENSGKNSNEVLADLRPSLEKLGFNVEKGKRKKDMINVPVLFGRQGSVSKSFRADAFCEESGFVLEIEAGRAIANNAFLKDLFQACMMYEVKYLGIAVRNDYRNSNDFESMLGWFDALYASERLQLPLEGVLAIGY